MLYKKSNKNNKRTKEQLEIMKEAKKIIIPRVEMYASLMGLSYNKIAIRLQKSRWGSCSSNNNLNFNALLIFVPIEVLDSVIIHELSHLKYMNHQKEFWDFVYKYISKENYKKCRDYLNKNGRELMLKYLTF